MSCLREFIISLEKSALFFPLAYYTLPPRLDVVVDDGLSEVVSPLDAADTMGVAAWAALLLVELAADKNFTKFIASS